MEIYKQCDQVFNLSRFSSLGLFAVLINLDLCIRAHSKLTETEVTEALLLCDLWLQRGLLTFTGLLDAYCYEMGILEENRNASGLYISSVQ